MKLKTFDTTNTFSTQNSKPVISITPKSGLIGFGMELTRNFFKDQNKVTFHQDTDNPKDWYIEIDMVNGFEMRFDKRGNNANACYAINKKSITDAICSSLGMTNHFQCLVSHEPIIVGDRKLYAIITSSAKSKI